MGLHPFDKPFDQEKLIIKFEVTPTLFRRFIGASGILAHNIETSEEKALRPTMFLD